MARRKKIDDDIENLAKAQDAIQFERILRDILKTNKRIVAEEKIREYINNGIANNTVSISQTNMDILNSYFEQSDAVGSVNEKLGESRHKTRDILHNVSSAFGWFDQIDGALKRANLSMGLVGGMGEEVTSNLKESAYYAASLGMSVKGLAEAQVNYSTQVGRSILLTNQSYKAIAQVSKGLGLTNEEATTLASNYQLIGYNIENVRDFIEESLVKTHKFGVNVNSVLRTMNNSFARANTFNFSKGVASFRDMAIYAEKFKINVDSAFNSMDMARTLEGTMEMASKMMVMGGEFSKTNPFELSFLARNRPEEYMKKMNAMTKGVYFFNEQTKQFQSSAFELDRLRAVADATGQDFQGLNQQAMRFAEIEMAKNKLIGFNEEDKEFISSVAQFNSATGKFTLSIQGNPIEISKLNNRTLDIYKEQQKSLEDRAKDALTFNETYTTFIEQFKATTLPILNTMNSVLKVVNSVNESTGGLAGTMIGGMAVLSGSLFVVKPLFSGLTNILTKLVKTPPMPGVTTSGFGMPNFGGNNPPPQPNSSQGGLFDMFKNLFKGKNQPSVSPTQSPAPIPPTLGNPAPPANTTRPPVLPTNSPAPIPPTLGNPNPNPNTNNTGGRGKSVKGKGFGKMMGKGTAMTAVAAGAAFLMVAQGVTMIADAYKDLDIDKIKQLNITLGISAIAIPATILAIGVAGKVASLGLLAVGASFALIGVGAMAMGKGIEYGSNGISNLMNTMGEVDTSKLVETGLGIGAISLGIASFANPLTLLGMAGFAGFIGMLVAAKKPISDFQNMLGGLGALNDDYTSLNSVIDNIKTMSTSDNSIISEIRSLITELNNLDKNMTFTKELKELFSKPLKVEFDAKSFSTNINLEVKLDSDTIYKQTLNRLPSDVSDIENNRSNSGRIKMTFS